MMYPSFWQAVVLVFGLIVCEVLFGGAFGLLDAVIDAIGGVRLPMWATLLPPILLSFWLILAVAARKLGVRIYELVALRPVAASIWAPLVLAVVGLTIVLSEADNLLRSVWPMPAWLFEVFLRLSREDWLGGLVVLAVVAPITEESLFRGVILRGFLQRYSVRWALIASAVLFGLAHLNPWQFAPGLIYGVFLGWLYYQTGSLLPPLVAHALANGWPHVFGPVLPPIPGFNSDPRGPVEFQPFWLDALGLGLAVIGIQLLVRHFRAQQLQSRPAAG